jgi:2-polyprenyl-3-methyl-5-hydroxy-6-metoxy-1,4-benzoquinol methylase
MKRTLEPELMDDPEQARAYARADFEKENQGFIDRFREYFPEFTEGHILDVGCGPGDIPVRLARALPRCRITGIDASEPMIGLAGVAVKQAGLVDRIAFRCERFQVVSLAEPADAAVSNSLVHHLPNPLQLWYWLRQVVKPGSPVLVMDLLRPNSPEEAQAIVDRYAAQEPEILRRDFYRSLNDVVDDRHWVVSGIIH